MKCIRFWLCTVEVDKARGTLCQVSLLSMMRASCLMPDSYGAVLVTAHANLEEVGLQLTGPRSD